MFWLCLFCLGTHFLEIQFYFFVPVFRIPVFEIPVFGIHFFRNPFFRNPFFPNPFLSELVFSESIFFGIHVRHLGKNEKNEKTREFRKMVVCNFCVETVKTSEFIFSGPSILAFLMFLGCGEVHASIQVWGGVLWGGGELGS